jgi:hypothetical protein
MLFKPFKSPLLVDSAARHVGQTTEPPPKRRKLSPEEDRKPLAVLKNLSSPEAPAQISSSNNGTEGYYLVLW